MTFTKRSFLVGGAALAAAVRARPLPAQAGEATQTATLDAHEGPLRLRPDGPETPVLRYGSAEPLPIFRLKQGEAAQFTLHNALAEPTSLQICGMRGQGALDDPATMAGSLVPPGGNAVLRFTPADSGTAWIRPRLGPADQAGRGLSGVLIVENEAPPALDHDLVCFLRDWRLDKQNRLVGNAVTPDGAPEVVVTIGNKPLPSDLVLRPGARLRLRLLNGSTRRLMVVACEGAKPMVVAIDGQPAALFQPARDTVPIGPGGRFDLMLDLPREAGQTVRLTLRGSERVDGALEPDRLLATIRTDGAALDAKPPIAALPPNPALPTKIPLETSRRATLTLDTAGAAWRVNGIAGVDWPKLPVLRVRQGDAVTLGFTNASAELVPLNLFGQALRLLHAKDDGWEPYWRDTVLLPPGSSNHVAFIADKAGRWPIESGFTAQAVAGLRCWFEVTRG